MRIAFLVILIVLVLLDLVIRYLEYHKHKLEVQRLYQLWQQDLQAVTVMVNKLATEIQREGNNENKTRTS